MEGDGDGARGGEAALDERVLRDRQTPMPNGGERGARGWGRIASEEGGLPDARGLYNARDL